MLQHSVCELDIECRPGRAPLVSRSSNPVDNLVLRIISGYQKVERIGYSKLWFCEYDICRGPEQRAFVLIAQIPKSLAYVHKIQRNQGCGGIAIGIQSMPDITMLTE